MTFQKQLHGLLPQTATAELVTLAPIEPADHDRLTVDVRGIFVLPAPHDRACDNYAEVVRFERLAGLPGRTAYQREHDRNWAMRHRAILKRRGMNTPPSYVPTREPDALESREELVEVGFADWQMVA